MTQILLVCGCARSGTTALARLLNSHEQMSIGLERYLRLCQKGQPITRGLFEEDRFFSIQKGDTWYESLDKFKNVYKALRGKWRDSLVIGDKLPELYEHIDKVFENIPDARIVFIARNVMDVASSWKRRATDQNDKAWSAKRDVKMGIAAWNASMSKTLAALEHHRRRIYVLRYESLYCDPKYKLDELFDFVGLKVRRPCANTIIGRRRSPRR